MFKRLIDYNDWANNQLFAALKAIDKEVPEKVLTLLGHIISAQRIWVSRIGNQPTQVKVWAQYPLDECIAWHEESVAMLKRHAEAPDRKISYTTTNGQQWESDLHDIMIHVINHGTYHRAQIATEMRKQGLAPVNTDYITFARAF